MWIIYKKNKNTQFSKLNKLVKYKYNLGSN